MPFLFIFPILFLFYSVHKIATGTIFHCSSSTTLSVLGIVKSEYREIKTFILVESSKFGPIKFNKDYTLIHVYH